MLLHDDILTFLIPENMKLNQARLIACWSPPPEGAVKLNVDGSFNPNTGFMGTGGLIRSNDCLWMAGVSTHEGAGNALLAEILAIKNGLVFAWDKGFRKVYCESDSLDVVNLLHKPAKLSCHTYAVIIMQIFDLVKLDCRLGGSF